MRGRRGQKRPADSDSTESSGTVKKAKTTAAKTAGYDTFPDDKFLFETANKSKNTTGELELSQGASKTTDKSKNTVEKLDLSQVARETTDAAESVRMMESLRSWEELEELERAMDCRQLLAFRQAYLSAHGELKPKFVAETESWGYQPRVFKLRTTVSLLYLALLYTEQPVLPADLIRYGDDPGFANGLFYCCVCCVYCVGGLKMRRFLSILHLKKIMMMTALEIKTRVSFSQQ